MIKVSHSGEDHGDVVFVRRRDHFFVALAAAGLDVLPHEPPRPHALLSAWRNDESWLAGRLIINPHNAFYSDQAMSKIRFEAAQTIVSLEITPGTHTLGYGF